MENTLIPIEIIENKIYMIRNHKVMLDSDLANLYDIETKNLNKAVKRNLDRFPNDFMFQLTDEEWESLRFQFGTSKEGKGGRRFNPYVFTEQGVAMLSSVLNSKQAIAVNVQIMRTFVKLREMALSHSELAKELQEIRVNLINYAQHNNAQIEEIFRQLDYLNELHKPSQIGF